MKNLFFKKQIGKHLNIDALELLMEHKGLQIMTYKIAKNQKLYLDPNKETDTVEFLYIIKGKIIFQLEDREEVLQAGDSFYTVSIKESTVADVAEESVILYIVTEEQYDEAEGSFEEQLAFVDEISIKDHYTGGHCMRVAMYAGTLLQYSKVQIASAKQLAYAAQLHDIGKYKIPDEVLLKKGRFTDEEREIMNQHAMYAAEMLKDKRGFSDYVSLIVSCHHERYDGSGYPYGLKGEEIPIEARIIGIADVFDAMTTTRPYQEARTPEKAIEEMQRFGKDFDPYLLEVFSNLVKEGIIHLDKLPEFKLQGRKSIETNNT